MAVRVTLNLDSGNNGRAVDVFIVSSYAPTSTHSEVEWEAYYDALSTALARRPPNAIVIIGADTNASIGRGKFNDEDNDIEGPGRDSFFAPGRQPYDAPLSKHRKRSAVRISAVRAPRDKPQKVCESLTSVPRKGIEHQPAAGFARLTECQLRALRDRFAQADCDGKGWLSRTDIVQLVEDLESRLSAAQTASYKKDSARSAAEAHGEA